MTHDLQIIPAVFCPWTKQLHSIDLCAHLCDWSGDVNDETMECNYEE